MLSAAEFLYLDCGLRDLLNDFRVGTGCTSATGKPNTDAEHRVPIRLGLCDQKPCRLWQGNS